jgi:hypothetical protein
MRKAFIVWLLSVSLFAGIGVGTVAKAADRAVNGTTPVTAHITTTNTPDGTCYEDMPCWDWRTMGNHTRCDQINSALYVCQRQGEGGLSGWAIWLESR